MSADSKLWWTFAGFLILLTTAIATRLYAMVRTYKYLERFRVIVKEIGKAHEVVYRQSKREHAQIDYFNVVDHVLSGNIQGIRFTLAIFGGRIALWVDGGGKHSESRVSLMLSLKRELSAEDALKIENLVAEKQRLNPK